MKKILLLNLLFLIAFTITAQKKKVEYGFQGGVNLNKVYGPSAGSPINSSNTGLSLGGNVKFRLWEHFAIKAQLSYDQFGWAYRSLVFENGIFNGTSTDIINKLNYLNLPILAEYSFGKKVKLNVDAGVYIAALLNYKIVEISRLPTGATTETKYQSDNGRRFIFGLAPGIGLQVPLTPTIFLHLGAKNYTSLTSFQKKGYPTKTTTLSFLTGLSFQL